MSVKKGSYVMGLCSCCKLDVKGYVSGRDGNTLAAVVVGMYGSKHVVNDPLEVLNPKARKAAAKDWCQCR